MKWWSINIFGRIVREDGFEKLVLEGKIVVQDLEGDRERST